MLFTAAVPRPKLKAMKIEIINGHAYIDGKAIGQVVQTTKRRVIDGSTITTTISGTYLPGHTTYIVKTETT